MRALKLLVIFLGLLLVVGVAALAVGVVYRMQRLPTHQPAALASRIELPPGAKLGTTEVANGRLVVRIDLPGGGGEILLFDLASGARLGTIEIAPAPSARP